MLSDLLIISAVKFEAEPTLLMLDKNSIKYDYIEVGIGPLNAAKSATALKEKASQKNVLYLGSAGTFGTFSAPYLVRVSKVWWMPTAERMGLAKHMKDLHRPIGVPLTENIDLPIKQVLTSSSISLNNEISVELPGQDLLIENMEAYPVTEQLTASAKSVDIIMGITNGVGPQGSEDWARYFKQVSQMTADYLEERLCQ